MEVLKEVDQGYVHNSSPGELAEGEWRRVLSSEGHWTGRIQFQARSIEAIQKAYGALHGCAIELDGASHMIEIRSGFVRNPKERAQGETN